MTLKENSGSKLRKIKAKWKVDSWEEYEIKEKELLKEQMYSKEPTIKGQVRVTAGKYRNFQIDIPRATRPLTDRIKVRVFDILGPDINKKTILDLYAGSGSFSYDAISRGAQKATLVDASKHAERVLKGNSTRLGILENTEIIKEKVEEYLYKQSKTKNSFDIIFLDPPYKLYNRKRTKKMEEIINKSADLLSGIRNPKAKFKGVLIIKHPRRYHLDILTLEKVKILETIDFGLNAITILIVDKKKK